LEGSVVNQIEISGFENEKDSAKFRKKLKSLKSVFTLSKVDKTLSFIAEEANWKMKEDYSLVYLFITEDSHPESEILSLAKLYSLLRIQHLVISPSEEGLMIHYLYSKGALIKKTEHSGAMVYMLGDLIKGGFE